MASETPATTTPQTEAALPEGWEHAVSPVDGRKYFYNAATGATSWTHPSVPGFDAPAVTQEASIITAGSIGDFSGILANRTSVDYGGDLSNNSTIETKKTAEKDVEEADVYTKMTEYDPTQPIHSHRCYAIIAMILFFPLGVIAFCKSLATVTKYKQGRYETAHDCGQQSLLFSRISCIVGVLFWSYFSYCYFAGPGAALAIEFPADWYRDFHFQEYANNFRDTVNNMGGSDAAGGE